MNIVNRFTLRTLQKNKVRTLVTILGIILATSMFVAVTSIITSLQKYMLDVVIEDTGDWHGKVYGINEKQKAIYEKEKGISNSSIAEVYENQGISKDVVFAGIDDNFASMLSMKISKGSMPENNSQIVMTAMTKNIYYDNYKIGDNIKLNIEGKKKEFKLVGICEQVNSEGSSSASGYNLQIYSKTGAALPESYTVYFKCKNISNVQQTLDNILKNITKADKESEDYIEGMTHTALLKFYGKSKYSNYNKLLYGMATILMLIIMVASVSLIHNAFSISISERTKQFGLLKSAGATKKQILRSVFFEAGVLCVIGIPIGIICGVVGIGITLNILGKQFAMLFTSSASASGLTMNISFAGILTAVLITVLTVLVSALIPAIKAVRLTVLQALKQNDVKGLKRKNVRVNFIFGRLFGFEGRLAEKNFKRNKKKQRVTIFSIAVSTALFVSVNSFTSYMSKSLELYKNNSSADISMELEKSTVDKKFKNASNALREFKGVDNIESGSYSLYDSVVAEIDIKDVNKTYLNDLKKMCADMVDEKSGFIRIDARVFYVADVIFNKYMKDNNLKTDDALVWHHLSIFDTEEQKNYSYDVFKSDANIKTYWARKKKGYLLGEVSNYKKLENSYYKENDDGQESEDDDYEKKYSGDAAFVSQDVKAVMCDKKLPLGVTDLSSNNIITIVRPYSAIKNIPAGVVRNNYYKFEFKAQKHSAATENLYGFVSQKLSDSTLYIGDLREDKEVGNSMIMIVTVFSYGFIILISLIVVANVFNTISTNILLRRQEFAMLKSVGMTKKSLNKMMNYECVLYGAKGLIFGMFAAVLLTYAMYKVMGEGFNVGFYIPVQSIVVVIISIFVVVFASMIYTMGKIRKDNVIETLRNDNI